MADFFHLVNEMQIRCFWLLDKKVCYICASYIIFILDILY